MAEEDGLGKDEWGERRKEEGDEYSEEKGKNRKKLGKLYRKGVLGVRRQEARKNLRRFIEN